MINYIDICGVIYMINYIHILPRGLYKLLSPLFIFKSNRSMKFYASIKLLY